MSTLPAATMVPRLTGVRSTLTAQSGIIDTAASVVMVPGDAVSRTAGVRDTIVAALMPTEGCGETTGAGVLASSIAAIVANHEANELLIDALVQASITKADEWARESKAAPTSVVTPATSARYWLSELQILR